MAEKQETHVGPDWQDTSRNPLIRVLLAIRQSFLLFIVALGVFMIGTGFVFQQLGMYYVLAAMFAIWGVSAILYAVGGYFFLKVIGYR
jgi:lipopolysaccharide export LptBFGC system permease protein LptF